MNEGIRSPEKEKQFIATTYIDLTRHGSRFGGPMAIRMPDGSERKFDDGTNLTPRGKSGAVEFGKTGFPPEVTLLHPRGGDEPRHGETGSDMLSESGKYGEARTEPARIFDKQGRVKGARRGRDVDYASAGMNPHLKVYKDLVNEKLNEIFSSLPGEEQERFLADPEVRAQYREQAQLTGLKEAMKNEALVQTAAENEAYELVHAVELSRRGVGAGENKAIPLVGSGMFAESLYKHALVVEDEATGTRKLGFDDVDEIGGFTKQASSFRIKLSRDTRMGNPRNMDDFDKDTKAEFEFTDPERAKLFGGKKVYLDWDKVRELARMAETRFNA